MPRALQPKFAKSDLACTYIDFHFSVKAIVQDEIVGHANSVGLHGMTLSIVVVANIP